MTEHHFFVSPSDVRGSVVELTGDEAHHAGRVLRVREGEAITVADGTGRVIRAVVTRVGDTIEADVTSERAVGAPRPSITLLQAVLKGDKMDAVIEKAVEIGVYRIVPFLAERTIVQWDDAKAQKARERWSAVARAASKQSRSPFLAEVMPVAASTDDVTHSPDLGVVLNEGTAERLHAILPSSPPVDLALAVGPEGGFTSHEIEGLESRGFVSAGLGDRILRAETAGLIAAAIVLHIYGSLG